MVPHALKAGVWATYVPGQERRKDPTRAYLDAAQAAIRAVWERERGQRRRRQPEALQGTLFGGDS